MSYCKRSALGCQIQKLWCPSKATFLWVEEQCISQKLSSPFAGRLHSLSYYEIKHQGEKDLAIPLSLISLHNSSAVLWVLFASSGGEDLTEPWPLPLPSLPALHPQELGLPVVWQKLCKHIPQSASLLLPPTHALVREETPLLGMWKGISMGFHEVALLCSSAVSGGCPSHSTQHPNSTEVFSPRLLSPCFAEQPACLAMGDPFVIAGRSPIQ